jgi:hypothetical protein
MKYLIEIDFLATIAVCMTISYFSVIAFKSTKFIGFGFLLFGSLFSAWNAISLHLLSRLSTAAFHFFHYSYPILFLVDAILNTVGVVLVIQKFIEIHSGRFRAISTNTAEQGAAANP